MEKKILIIDDNLSITKMLKDYLELKKYDVEVASNGREGLIKSLEFKPEIIILDILMPEMDGFETLKGLKSNIFTSHIPVILNSIVENYRKEGLRLGAVDFVSKPIDFDRLFSSIKNTLGEEKKLIRKSVLIIDDDENIVELTKDFLESKGINALGATKGSEGISIAKKGKVGLIIVDLDMPEMDGFEVIKRLKKESLTSNIPIIVVTNVDLKKYRQKCLMLGAEECFSKSFDRKILISKVLELIRSSDRAESAKKVKAKILITDDEESIVELIKDILEMEGYETITAINGKEALEKIYSESPDVVILDISMPVLSGYQVCQKVREDILMRNLPIIMLTVKSSEEFEIKGLELGVDDYLTKPFRPAILLARIKSALFRVQQSLSVNPLTYLPGNTAIVKEIEFRLKNNMKFAVLYFDIDRFKSLNDYYGFHKGDEVIKATARIIISSTNKLNPDNGFVGHIGGDDFIGVIDDDNIDIVCSDIIKKFDRTVPSYYDEKNRKKGYIVVENRQGIKEKFPLATISIGVVSTKVRRFSHVGEISKLGAELKKFAKKDERSNYIIDKRKKDK